MLKGITKNYKSVVYTGIALALSSCGGGGGSDVVSQALIETVTQAPLEGTVEENLSITQSRTRDLRLEELIRGRSQYTNNQRVFDSSNISFPYGYRVSGQGQVITVIDDGLDTTHEKFAGKTLLVFEPEKNVPQEHATHVASVAVGGFEGGQSMGVAYSSDLHFTSFFSADLGFSPRQWALAVRSARVVGSIAQNNSWGWETFGAEADINAIVQRQQDNAWTAAQTLQSSFSALGSEQRWQGYIDELKKYQEQGVIVFALSNNDNLRNADISAALPELEPDLKESWLAVTNVSNGVLYSAPCGRAASYCLGADGLNVLGAKQGGGYQRLSGTSIAAPQVTAGVALLAEAFPTLSPSQIQSRILASANNTFSRFSDAQVVTAGGVRLNNTLVNQNFSESVAHTYSSVYGHGVLDLRAALLPLGTRSIPTSKTRSVSLEETAVVTTGPISRALQKAFEEEEILFVDGLETPFFIQGNVLTRTQERKGLKKLEKLAAFGHNHHRRSSVQKNKLSYFKQKRAQGWDRGAEFSFGPEKSFNVGIFKGEVASFLGGWSLREASLESQNFLPAPLLLTSAFVSLAEDNSQALGLSFNPKESQAFTFHFFRGQQKELDESLGTASGFVSSYQQKINKNLKVKLSLGGVYESESFLGEKTTGAFGLGDSTLSFFSGLGLDWTLNDKWAFQASYERGFSRFSSLGSSLIQTQGGLVSEAFSLGVSRKALFVTKDVLALSLSQPIQLIKAKAFLSRAELSETGEFSFKRKEISLVSPRKFDLSLSYTREFDSKDTSLSVALEHSFEGGGDSNETTLFFKYEKKF